MTASVLRSGLLVVTVAIACSCSRPGEDRASGQSADPRTADPTPRVDTSRATPAPPTTSAQDAAVIGALRSTLAARPDSAATVQVDARAGVVTLRGHVSSEEERSRLLQEARATQGVTRVEDHLNVSAGGSDIQGAPSAATAATPTHQTVPVAAPVPDADATLVNAINSSLNQVPTAGSTPIAVSSTNGIVVIKGNVPDTAARQQILDRVRGTSGVVQIVDRLRVQAGAATRRR